MSPFDSFSVAPAMSPIDLRVVITVMKVRPVTASRVITDSTIVALIAAAASA
ncbi:hypothetical protein D3C86_2186070 [compost metagenome]